MEELKSPVEAGVGNRADRVCEDHVQSLSLDNSVCFPGNANIRQFVTVFYCLRLKKRPLKACPFSPEPFLTKEQVCKGGFLLPRMRHRSPAAETREVLLLAMQERVGSGLSWGG